MNKTLIFIDPGYDTSLGHYTREGELIMEEAEKCCIELKHFVSLDVPEDRANELGLIRRFNYKAGLDWVEDPIETLRDFYIELDKILKETPEKEGHVYEVLMYTGHPFHLPIAAFLLNKHRSRLKKISAHVCIFYLDLGFCRGETSDEYKRILKKISRLIEVFDPGRLLKICTDSERTKQVYSPYFERQLKTLPFPIESGFEIVVQDKPERTGKLKIVYIGNTIKRTGYDFVYEAYKEISRMDIFRTLEFKIKHTPREQLADLYRDFLRETENISHISKFLTNKELLDFYGDSDIIMLPYSKRYYPCQTSGIVVEALSMGKILIVPEETWMADQIEEYGSGETFVTDDLKSFIQAVVRVVNNFENYKERSNRNIEKFRSLHSASNLFSEIGLKGYAVDMNDKTCPVEIPFSNGHIDSLREIAPEDAEWERLNALLFGCVTVEWKMRRSLKIGRTYFNQYCFDDAEEKFKEALSIAGLTDDNKVSAVLLLGGFYLLQGRDAEAENEYLKALTFESISNEFRYNLLQALGALYLKKKEHDKAKEIFRKALSLKNAFEKGPMDTIKLEADMQWKIQEKELLEINKKGEELYAQGDIDGALECFIKVIEIEPDDVTANNNIGVLYLQAGRINESLKFFKRVLRQYPFNRDTTINCAEAMKMLRDFEAAVKLYKAFLTVNPEDKEIQELMMHIKGSEGLNIVYIPGFGTEEELADQYYRILWHMNPIIDDINYIYVPLIFDDLEELKMTSYMDPEIEKLEEKFNGKFVMFPDNEEELWKKYLEGADILMNWKMDFRQSNDAVDSLIRSMLQTKKKWDVDKGRVQQDGLMYLRMSHDANRNYRDDLQSSMNKFQELIQDMGLSRKGYIFGTGPSLAEAMEYDFSDGVTIACNSMVKNDALLTQLNPKVFVFGDPIFHAGCSSYAGEFRKHLYKALDKYNPFMIVPFRDYKSYIENMPRKYRDRIIGIPTGGYAENLNLNLKERFIVKPTRNILTLLLIPIACTLFDEIGIMGCDGRKLEENQYFWNHHKESQFNDRMDDIKKAHPAFFDIDYNDYYLTHCEILETWLTEAEKMGVKIKNLTESYIPALLKRSGYEIEKEAVG